jgi:hypothetical protein
VAGSYVVFSQAPVFSALAVHAAPDVDAWDAHARRFFDARLGLADEPRMTGAGVELSVVVAPLSGSPGVRSVVGRPREAGDLASADEAEKSARGSGLAALAHRCTGVWVVGRDAERDPLALLLAAVLASVSLGPIVEPSVPEIFGVKTARTKLAALGA